MGEKFESAKDNRLNRELAQAGLFGGELVEQKDFVLEGGSIESDGKGTLFTTADCLLAPHRNQPLSQESIEAELKKRLGMKRVIWLQCAPLPGDDTDGHIDTLVRTAPNDTLLYVGCGEDEDKQHHGLLRLERQLCAPHGRGQALQAAQAAHAPCHRGEGRATARHLRQLLSDKRGRAGACVWAEGGRQQGYKHLARGFSRQGDDSHRGSGGHPSARFGALPEHAIPPRSIEAERQALTNNVEQKND